MSKGDVEPLVRLCNLLNLFYEVNRKYRKISYKEFYNETANEDKNFKKVPSKMLKQIERNKKMV